MPRQQRIPSAKVPEILANRTWCPWKNLRSGKILPAVAPSATATTMATAITSTAAAPAPSAVASTAAVAASTTTAATFGLRTRFVHVDGAAADLRTVQSRDRLVSIFIAGHLHETEAARTPRVAVGHDADPVNLSVSFKRLP